VTASTGGPSISTGDQASDASALAAGPAPRGVTVRLSGVVHLYRQSGKDVVALRGVDLDVDAGEMVALLGPSGMGKTTVLRLMAGTIKASAGTVKVGEHDLGRLSAAERRALRAGDISHIVQGTAANILPYATALQNVWFTQHGARRRGRTPPWRPRELLDMLGLSELADARLAGLPRGLQQQVAVAAGVGAGPRLVLADEPTSQLTEEAAVDVVHLLRRINSELSTTVVIVTHDPTIATMFPRTVTIRDGRVGAEGRHGEEFAVVDGSGSIQLPPDVLEIFPPNTRVRVVRGTDWAELRLPEDQG
jgi:putative ABC transport system ATP-binding protein